MIPFFLYSLSGVSWSLLNIALSSITTPIAGDPRLALIGSTVLALAGILALLRPRAAACLALVGLVGFGQAIVLSTVVVVSKGHFLDSGLIVPISWLLGLSFYAVMSAVQPRFLEKWPAWIFPGNPSGQGQKILFWSLSISVTALAISYWLFVGRASGTVTYEMTWDYPNEQKVVLTYVGHPGYFQTCYSDELARYLQLTGRSTVPVVFRIIKNYGTIRGFYVQTVGTWENKEFRCNIGEWDIKTAYSRSMGSDPFSLFMEDWTPKENTTSN